jgi:hypothetical protein
LNEEIDLLSTYTRMFYSSYGRFLGIIHMACYLLQHVFFHLFSSFI